MLRKLKDERKAAADHLVFLHEGKPWKTWRRSFRTALKHAGIKNFRFHDLRHCFGSWLAMASTANKAHMELMGHRDPKMTLRYSHISVEYKRQAVAKLPQFDKAILEAGSQQISQQPETANVVSFGR